MGLKSTNPHVFQDHLQLVETRLAGWAALSKEFSINAPVRWLSCVSNRHVKGGVREESPWRVFDKRYWPGDEFGDQLSFALRYEPLDLLLLKRLFQAVKKGEIENFIRNAPSGVANRRTWFFYEMLMGRTLDIPAVPAMAAVDALDPSLYFTGQPKLSKRHRVRDNLLGTMHFSPIIRRTKALEQFVDSGLKMKAGEIIGRTRAPLLTRAASFLLLADSQASFKIEGEQPPRGRLERWGKAVLQAGRNPLTLNEINRLHGILIEDKRFVQTGLRPDGVFLGERDHQGDPLPEFIGARPSDLEDLMQGLLTANDRMRHDAVDPVLQAAATAFGFVYIHPFQDGNGRLHRCLIHHVLAEWKLTPTGLVLPVSSVMLDWIDRYRETLRGHSGPLMAFIDWHPTPEKNVEVLNDTADFYRYFDCTEAASFLYACVDRAIKHELPQEIDYLTRHDEAIRRIMERVEMPDKLAESLVMFIRQNYGKLGQNRRNNEFKQLSDSEVQALELIVSEAFS